MIHLLRKIGSVHFGFALLCATFLFLPILYLPSIFSDAHLNTKWFGFYFSATVLSITALFFKKSHIELNSDRLKVTKWILLYFLTIFIASLVFGSSIDRSKQLLDWTAFSLISFWFLKIFLNDKNHQTLIEKISKASLLSYILVWAVIISQASTSKQPDFLQLLPSTFGHWNLAAEYLSILIIFLLFGFPKKPVFSSGASFHRIRGIFLVILSIHLLLLGSEAAILGVTGAISTYVIRKFLLEKANIRALLFLILYLGLVAFFFSFKLKFDLSDHGVTQLSLENRSMVESTRIRRWANTMVMIGDQPLLGYGPGGFEFNYSKYHHSIYDDEESNHFAIARSPHNGYLEAFVDGGFLLALPLLVLIFFCYLWLWKNRAHPELSQILFALATFILIDAFFAFPLETPYLFFIASLVVGGFLSLWLQPRPKTRSFTFFDNKINFSIKTLVAIGLTIGLSSFLYSYSSYKLHPDQKEKIQKACNIFPSHWQACLLNSIHLYNSNHFSKAILSTNIILSRTPSAYPFLRLRGLAHIENKEISLGCADLKNYARTFEGKLDFQGRDEKIAQALRGACQTSTHY